MKGRNLAAWFLCVALSACTNAAEREAPRELVGVWKTPAPGYEDCELEIKPRLIIFNNGLTHTDSNHIRRVKTVTMDAARGYAIDYEDSQGLEYTLSLIYGECSRGDVIRFKNQRQVTWKRSEPAIQSAR